MKKNEEMPHTVTCPHFEVTLDEDMENSIATIDQLHKATRKKVSSFCFF